MDDDTVTPAHLKEANPIDEKCKGRLTWDLSGIYCFADPSHRKRVVKNKFYASSLSSEQAAKLGKDFGYFVNQNKNGTLEEFRRKRFVILRHNCGDHSLCGSWCKAKRALDANKPYNVKPILNCETPLGKRRIIEVYHILDKYTSDKCLLEMMHPWNTQLNESLNMRAAELAPKSKNFSRSHSLRYRLMHVIGVHNMGYELFYGQVMSELGIELSDTYSKFLSQRDIQRKRKIVYDRNPDIKRRRAFKFQAKVNSEIYLERTKDVTEGDYGHGIRKSTQNKKTKVPTTKKRKKSNPCNCGGEKEHFRSNSKYCLKSKKT